MYMLQSIKRDAGQANYRNRKAVTLALKGRYVHQGIGYRRVANQFVPFTHR